MDYQLDRAGKLLVATWEAISLVAYVDSKEPGAPLAIGFGENDPTLKPGDTITLAEAFRRFDRACATRVRELNAQIEKSGLHFDQHQFNALFDLKYQSGNRYLPKLLKLLAKDYDAAMLFWLNADANKAGVKLKGLSLRRKHEVAVYERGQYGDQTWLKLWRGNPHATKWERYDVQPGDLV